MLSAPEKILPEVSFDIDLGKKYSSVEFDYDTYERMIYAMGGTEADYMAAKILIGTPIRGGLSQGKFSTTTGMIKDNAWKYRINTNLAHETCHYLDQRQERISIASVVAGNLSILGCFGAGALNVTARAASYIPFDTMRHVTESITSVTDPIMIFGLGAVFTLYYLSPHERRARKASRNNSGQVIKLTK